MQDQLYMRCNFNVDLEVIVYKFNSSNYVLTKRIRYVSPLRRLRMTSESPQDWEWKEQEDWKHWQRSGVDLGIAVGL